MLQLDLEFLVSLLVHEVLVLRLVPELLELHIQIDEIEQDKSNYINQDL